MIEKHTWSFTTGHFDMGGKQRRIRSGELPGFTTGHFDMGGKPMTTPEELVPQSSAADNAAPDITTVMPKIEMDEIAREYRAK